MGTGQDDIRSVSSAVATLSLAQSFILDELAAISPEAAKRVANSLKGYVQHIERLHGVDSVDAITTRLTVDMIARTELEIGNDEG